jgi:Fe-S oxidoreductase
MAGARRRDPVSECQLALGEPFLGVCDGPPGSVVPDDHAACGLPELDAIDMRDALERTGVRVATSSALGALSESERSRNVVVVQDAFTTHYDSVVVLDLLELMQRLGSRPWLAPFHPNGKPQHVLGMLDEFNRTAGRNARMLKELADTGASLVGLDSSMTLAYRAEYVKGLGKEAVPPIALPQEWLAQRLDELPQLAVDGHPSWTLLPHRTERTNAPAATSDWVTLGRRLGVDLQIAASGC